MTIDRSAVKSFILLFFLLATSLTLHAQQRSEIVNCLYEAYQPEIDFYKVLHELEAQLLEEGVIQDTTGLDYQLLVERFNEDNGRFALEQLQVEKYLSPEPFKGCITDARSSADLDQTFRYIFLMSIYLDLARQGSHIKLMIDEYQAIWVNGKGVTMENLESKLLEQRKKLLEKGVPEEQLTLDMKVSQNTKMGLIVDIQTLLRKVNIRRINYYSYE